MPLYSFGSSSLGSFSTNLGSIFSQWKNGFLFIFLVVFVKKFFEVDFLLDVGNTVVEISVVVAIEYFVVKTEEVTELDSPGNDLISTSAQL